MQPNYKQLYNIVKKIFDKTNFFNHSAWDETFYTMRVYEIAKEIIKKIDQDVDEELILVSALLHDIGKSKINLSVMEDENKKSSSGRHEWKRHGVYGIPIAKKILEDLSFSKDFIDKVCYLVEFHDERHIENKTIELMILQDADLIADSGYAGFIRPFLYAGKRGRSIIDTLNYLNTVENRADDKGLLNLEISRVMAEEKMKIEKGLILEMSKEIESDLL